MFNHNFYKCIFAQQAIEKKSAIAQHIVDTKSTEKNIINFNDVYRKIEHLEKTGYTIAQINYCVSTFFSNKQTDNKNNSIDMYAEKLKATLSTYSTTHTDLHTVFNKTIKMFDSDVEKQKAENTAIKNAEILRKKYDDRNEKMNIITVKCKKLLKNGKIKHCSYKAIAYSSNEKFNDFVDVLNAVKITLSTVKTKHVKMSDSATVCKKLCVRLGVIGAVYNSMCNFLLMFEKTEIHTAKINEYITHIYNRLKVDDNELCDMLSIAIRTYISHIHNTTHKNTTQQAIAINKAYTAINKYLNDSAKTTKIEINNSDKHIDDTSTTMLCLYDVATAQQDLNKYNSDKQTDSDKQQQTNKQKQLLINAIVDYINSFTATDSKIFHYYCFGDSVRIIADKIGFSKSTIDRHLKAIKDNAIPIFEKYGANYSNRHYDNYITEIMKNVHNGTYNN